MILYLQLFEKIIILFRDMKRTFQPSNRKGRINMALWIAWNLLMDEKYWLEEEQKDVIKFLFQMKQDINDNYPFGFK